MALPAGWTLVPFTGRVLGYTGLPLTGRITFESAQEVVVDGTLVVPRVIEAALDADGEFSVDLPSTDAPSITPGGWTYTVRELWEGGRTYSIVVPYNGGTINLADVVPHPDIGTVFVPGPPGPAGPVEEAPEDGTPYSRQDAGWVPAGTGGGIAVGAGTEAELLQINAAGTTPARAGYTAAAIVALIPTAPGDIGAEPASTAATAVSNHVAATDPHGDRAYTDTQLGSYQLTSAKGQANGYASLDSSGHLPQGQLPAIAITEYLGAAANEAAMLAQVGQLGDWCSRTDLGTVWIITGADPTQLASWTQIVYPASPVQSVAGRTGAVVLSSTDISDSTTAGRALLTAADAAAQRSALSLGTAAQAATGDFEPAGAVSTHNATAGAHGISTFGASLIDDADAAAARTTLGLGTAATAATSDFATAAQGTDARTPTAHAASHATAGSDALTPSDIGAQATLVSGTNIKTINSTSILGSGDLAISATPAGSGTELQYRNGSSFGAVAGTSWASNQLLITAQSASATPMAVRAAASQSANIFEWQGSTGTVLAAVRESGGTGFFRARRFEFSDDPTNRHISSHTWISNLAIELATSTNNAAISVATGNNDNYRVFFHADTVNLRPQVLSQLGRSILFGAANADAVANRPVGEALLSGASCNAAGQSISGGAVVGGAARVLGGNGASGATTAAANGGDVYITPGIGYGTGRHGLAILPISRVPTSDPGVPGAIWNDSGTLKISP